MSELLDLFHGEAVESERSWSPEEIAERVLKMKAGAGTPSLVRAVLRADGRFQERADGSWEVRRARAVSLGDEAYRLCWFEPGEGDALRVHLASWTNGSAPSAFLEIDGCDPARWFSRAGELFRERWVTLQPAICQRWLSRMDRRWAMGESAQEPLDLLSWVRLLLLDEGVAAPDLRFESSPERLAARWSIGRHSDDGPGRVRFVAQILDLLLEREPDRTHADLERARAERLESRPLDWSRFEFPRSALDEIPNVPGVYRLRGEGGSLLYVGKALSLSRRVQEHFRSLPAERSKREEMLVEVRSFEYEELPSELEALIREYRAIVREGPTWNVQAQVHPPRRFPPDWTWPLIYLAPGEGPVRTVVVLTGADGGALVALDPASPDGTDLADVLGHLTSGQRPEDLEEAVSSVLVLEPPEAWLALRYYVRFRDRIDRIDALTALSPAELSGRMHGLVDHDREVHPREVRG